MTRLTNLAKALLVAWAILPLMALQVAPEDARLVASLSSAEANLGDPVTLEVQLFMPQDWRPQSEAPLPPKVGEAKVLSQNYETPEQSNGDAPTAILRAQLAWYKLDQFSVPSQTLTFFDSENKTHQLTIPELQINIVDLLEDGDAQLAPEKGQMALPASMFLWILIGLAVLVLLALLVFAILYYRKREPAPKPPKPLPPPHLEALDALAALTSKTYLKEGKVKAFYVEIALIVRHYYSRLYGIHAEEMTSFELEDYFQERSDLPDNFFDLNREFQEMCDRVKFAKYDPLETENKHVVNMAYEIVELLKPQPQPQGGVADVSTR